MGNELVGKIFVPPFMPSHMGEVGGATASLERLGEYESKVLKTELICFSRLFRGSFEAHLILPTFDIQSVLPAKKVLAVMAGFFVHLRARWQRDRLHFYGNGVPCSSPPDDIPDQWVYLINLMIHFRML